MSIPFSIQFDKETVIRISLNVSNDNQKTTAHKQIREYLNQQRTTFTFSYEIRGTPFQKAIYKALMDIPFGQTTTYKELAEKAGYPKAQRAVGNALGNNPLVILVPCHRVIASDGSIGGFTGGIPMKRHLLALEGHRNF